MGKQLSVVACLTLRCTTDCTALRVHKSKLSRGVPYENRVYLRNELIEQAPSPPSDELNHDSDISQQLVSLPRYRRTAVLAFALRLSEGKLEDDTST